MANESCRQRIEIVEKLGEAINQQKRLQEGEHSTEERLRADEAVSELMEALRSHKSSHECAEEEKEGAR